MVQILDQHLDKLVCSQCQKYLSVLPVKVYPNGSIKCGRCCNKNDNYRSLFCNNDEGVASLYQEMAKLCLFRCVNRYEGCKKILASTEVVAHEKTCVGKNYSCPSCVNEPQMTAYQLFKHFGDRHNNNFLTSNVFHFTLARNVSKENFFYVQNDIIFIILLQLVPNYNSLYISIVTLNKVEGIKQQFILSTETVTFKQTTAKEKCVSLDDFSYENYNKIDVTNILNQLVKLEIILDMSATSTLTYDVQMSSEDPKNVPTMVTQQCQTISEKHIHTVELTSEFFKHYPEYDITACGTALYSNMQLRRIARSSGTITEMKRRIELTCSNCKQMMDNNVYSCISEKHLVCWDCKTWCGLCDSPVKGWSSETAAMYEYLLFPCKWKCGTKCAPGDLRDHELYCDKNIRKCCICNAIMCMKYLKTHFPTVHRCEFVEKLNLTAFLKNHSRSREYYYFIVNNSMFKMKWTVYNSRYNLHIEPCDDMKKLELFVVKRDWRHSLDNGNIKVMLEHNPQFYLQYL